MRGTQQASRWPELVPGGLGGPSLLSPFSSPVRPRQLRMVPGGLLFLAGGLGEKEAGLGPSFRAWLSHPVPGMAVAGLWQTVDPCCGLRAVQVELPGMLLRGEQPWVGQHSPSSWLLPHEGHVLPHVGGQGRRLVASSPGAISLGCVHREGPMGFQTQGASGAKWGLRAWGLTPPLALGRQRRA